MYEMLNSIELNIVIPIPRSGWMKRQIELEWWNEPKLESSNIQLEYKIFVNSNYIFAWQPQHRYFLQKDSTKRSTFTSPKVSMILFHSFDSIITKSNPNPICYFSGRLFRLLNSYFTIETSVKCIFEFKIVILLLF